MNWYSFGISNSVLVSISITFGINNQIYKSTDLDDDI